MITFKFDGTPLAKQRHRSTRQGRTYNPQSKEEAAVKWEAKKQYHRAPFSGPVTMSVRAVFPRPNGHFGTGRNQYKLKPSSPKYHTKKSDVDNIVKFYADCLNGIAYMDDCQVIEISSRKEWSDDRNHIGLTEVIIKPVEI